MIRWSVTGPLAITLGLALSCQSRTAPVAAPESIAHAPVLGVARIERREIDDRPPLYLVARVGDPLPAMALAVAHDQGSVASVALSTLLSSRMRAKGVSVEARPHGLGFELVALVPKTAAGSFIRAASEAFAEPVASNDPALGAVFEATNALRARTFVGPAEAEVAACSGELGLAPGAAVWETKTLAAQLEATRKAAYSAGAAAFAALGPPAHLDAASEALADTAAWPSATVPDDPWQKGDFVGFDATVSGRRRLSVALRVADPDAAIQAAQRLGRPSSALVLGLAALGPGWVLERAVATARVRGACLRLDATASTDPGPAARDVARAAELVSQAAALELESAENLPKGAALDASVLRPSDPREAASSAAWRALVGRNEAGPTRRLTAYSAPAAEQRIARELAAALETERAAFARPTLEVRQRVEAGQSEFWMLVATPCGTTETKDDAGLGALVVRALAERTRPDADVTLEPWVSPDGIGLLAHAAPRDLHETGPGLAARVAAALGRALIGPKPSGVELAAARAGLLEELGPGPRAGFWFTLEAASAGHSAWLEPRGTFSSLAMATSEAVAARHRDLSSGPLRVAVLSNQDEAQARLALTTLERWLRPVRFDDRQCVKGHEIRPRTGEFTIETTAQDPPEGAYVAVSLEPQPFGPSRAAEATLFLLNRRGGWLDQALAGAGLAASARARFQGGGHAAALIVDVRAVDRKRDAVAQVRALFDRLARGAASEADLAAAEKEHRRLHALAALDPRRRIVDLWRSAEPESRLDLKTLRAFHTSLRADSHVVVYVNPTE